MQLLRHIGLNLSITDIIRAIKIASEHLTYADLVPYLLSKVLTKTIPCCMVKWDKKCDVEVKLNLSLRVNGYKAVMLSNATCRQSNWPHHRTTATNHQGKERYTAVRERRLREGAS
jgi:hypothetical protein